LERAGIPETPEDLIHHNCLIYTLTSDNEWHFDEPGGKRSITVSGNYQSTEGFSGGQFGLGVESFNHAAGELTFGAGVGSRDAILAEAPTARAAIEALLLRAAGGLSPMQCAPGLQKGQSAGNRTDPRH